MPVKILVADPAKNITVFVLDQIDSLEERRVLARAMLADRGLGAEQVGFVIPPGPGAAPWRLEMAGGEFCGNAARCFGLYVARMQGLKGRVRVFVSVSGADAPVRVEVDVEQGRAAAEMPGPAAIGTLLYEGRTLPALVFDGITHIIAPDLEAKRETFFAVKSLVEEKFSAPGQPAASALGLMFYDTASRFMRPAVYVRSTDSLVFESSCGSGSAALGVWLSRDLLNGAGVYSIAQPGGAIETEVTKSAGEITGITIGGEVKLGEPVMYPLG